MPERCSRFSGHFFRKEVAGVERLALNVVA